MYGLRQSKIDCIVAFLDLPPSLTYIFLLDNKSILLVKMNTNSDSLCKSAKFDIFQSA